MDTEPTATIERRVAGHAALADPTRLRIVDLLAVSDRTASELSATLQIPSNLLAHHLKVLDGASLIARRRSEGDRRRSYLTIDLSHPLVASTVAPERPTARRILFVCTANTARSHLAAALWGQASPITAESAGTHPGEQINPGAIETARRHGLALPAVTPRTLSHEDTKAGHLVITVCDRAHEELHGADWAHWSIRDPVPHDTTAAFDRAFDEIAHRVTLLAPLLGEAS